MFATSDQINRQFLISVKKIQAMALNLFENWGHPQGQNLFRRTTANPLI